MYPTFSACLLLPERIRLGNQTQLDGLFSQSRAHTEGGNQAGALPATFSEKSVDMKALNSAPPLPLAAKVLSSFYFIYINSPKSDCSKWPAVD